MATNAGEKNTRTKKTEKPSAGQEMKLEDAMKRLSEIVSALEDSHADLEQSLGLYEEGVKLVRICSEKLDRAEQRVMQLRRSPEGDLQEVPFAEDEPV